MSKQRDWPQVGARICPFWQRFSTGGNFVSSGAFVSLEGVLIVPTCE